jgi:hypothetical protein
MRDPATNLVVKELTNIAYQYLCEREFQELNDAINASPAMRPITAEELLRELAISRRISKLGLRPSARKRGRPPQQRERHVQIAGAVAMLVEFGLKPTRSHMGRLPSGSSACSIVTAALARLGEHLDERTVEGIWHRYRRSPTITYPKASNYIRNQFQRSSLIIR